MKTLKCCLVVLCLVSALAPGFSQNVSQAPIRHPSPSSNPIAIADDQVFEGITNSTIAIEKLTDEEVAGVYAGRMVSHPASPWRSIVDKDLLSRPNAWRILLEILRRPKHNGVRGGLWGWLSRHPNYPHVDELLSESVRIFEEEGRTLGASPLSGLADFIAYVGTPEQAKLLDEIEKAGALQIELARSRYAKRIQAEKEATSQTTSTINGNINQPPAPASPNLKAPSGKPTAATGKQPVSTSWLVSGAVIAAAIGLLWLLLKRRS